MNTTPISNNNNKNNNNNNKSVNQSVSQSVPLGNLCLFLFFLFNQFNLCRTPYRRPFRFVLGQLTHPPTHQTDIQTDETGEYCASSSQVAQVARVD